MDENAAHSTQNGEFTNKILPKVVSLCKEVLDGTKDECYFIALNQCKVLQTGSSKAVAYFLQNKHVVHNLEKYCRGDSETVQVKTSITSSLVTLNKGVNQCKKSAVLMKGKEREDDIVMQTASDEECDKGDECEDMPFAIEKISNTTYQNAVKSSQKEVNENRILQKSFLLCKEVLDGTEDECYFIALNRGEVLQTGSSKAVAFFQQNKHLIKDLEKFCSTDVKCIEDRGSSQSSPGTKGQGSGQLANITEHVSEQKEGENEHKYEAFRIKGVSDEEFDSDENWDGVPFVLGESESSDDEQRISTSTQLQSLNKIGVAKTSDYQVLKIALARKPLNDTEVPATTSKCKLDKEAKWNIIKEDVRILDTGKTDCYACGKAFLSVKALTNHFLKNHEEFNIFQCFFCNISFQTLGTLKKHEISHDFSYTCKICSMMFAQRKHLLLHFTIHVGKSIYKCGLCDKVFVSHATRCRHIMLNHKNLDFLECSHCDKKFKQPFELANHMHIHLKTEPFKCGYCNKKFTVQNMLETHIKIHKDIRPYHCAICDKKFRRRYHLKLHKERVHKMTQKANQ